MPKVTIEGKPRIFFSDNAPDKPWRLTEKVVAVIESYFQKLDDLYIFSSKRIRNIVGDPVEVDVAFANISDPTSIFEFIQIRDRRNTEGRPWIEQMLGQRTSTGMNAGIAVSTEQFSDQAIRLAKQFKIPLRLILPEIEEKIKEWYRPDTIGMQSPIVDIASCSILSKVDNQVFEYKADSNRCMESNILVATSEAHTYKVISLSRVFDVDVMQNDKRQEELLSKVPDDNKLHRAVIAIQYHHPRLYLKVGSSIQSKVNIKEIQSISGIVFFTEVNRQSLNSPIIYRYKYIDALNNTCIAQAIVAEVKLNSQRHYICLVRHNIDGDNRNLGGAFFH
jgi:hypothetical protein